MAHPIFNPRVFRIYSSPYWWGVKAKSLKIAGELCRTACQQYSDEFYQLHLEQDEEGIKEFIANKGLGPMDVDWAMFGFSLELLLKGIIYHREPRYILNGVISHKHDKGNQLASIHHHDLIKLFGLIGENLKSAEYSCCEFLNNKMKNYRYPVPNDMIETQKNISIVGNIYDTYLSLFERLKSIVDLYTITGHLKTTSKT